MPPSSAVCTPGTMKARSLKSRPLSGISVISRGAMTSPRDEVSVLSSGTVACTSYALGDGANLEYDVEAGGLADGEFQGRLARHLEAGLFDGYFVSSRREAGDGVLTFRAGARSADLIRADVADTDRGLDHTGATGIGDAADEGRGGSLRRNQPGEQQRTGKRSATNRVRIVDSSTRTRLRRYER